MKKIYAYAGIAALTLAAGTNSFGQAFSFKEKGWGFYVNGGGLFSDADKRFDKLGLNEVSIGNDAQDGTRDDAVYPNPGSSLISFGIGGLGISSGIVYGGEVNFLMSSKKEASYIDSKTATGKAGHNYSLSGQNAGVDVIAKIGVIAYQAGGFVIYPTVGVGYGLYGTNLQDSRDNRYYPFYAGEGNNENFFISNSNVLFDFALNPEYYVGSSEKDKAKGFKIGLSLGYRVQLASNKYSTNFKSSKAAPYVVGDYELPKLGLSGFYVKLAIGLGKVYK